MRTLITQFSSNPSIISHFRRNPLLLLLLLPLARIPQSLLLSLPIEPSMASPRSQTSPPSRILQSNPTPVDQSDEDDGPMNEFLSRFVWAIRGKLSEAYPTVGLDTLNGMLLVIYQKAVAEWTDLPPEPQSIVGRCKKIDDKILALNAEEDDPSPIRNDFLNKVSLWLMPC